jgi:hypothetical protein
MSANRGRYFSGKPQRKLPERPASGDTFLIVVEGEDTERIYLDAVRDRLKRKPAMVVVYHGAHTDPEGIVREAINKKEAQKGKAGKGTTEPYDQVWVVFDREKKNDPRLTQFPKALQLAEANDIRVAHSIPSFEFWLLLHFRYTTASCHDCDAVVKMLNRFIRNYSKSDLPMGDLINRIPTAMKHAAQCHNHWASAPGDGYPSTHVDKLLQELNDSAQADLRIFKSRA